MLDKAYKDGELFWDSADVYGDNEELIGKLPSHSLFSGRGLHNR